MEAISAVAAKTASQSLGFAAEVAAFAPAAVAPSHPAEGLSQAFRQTVQTLKAQDAGAGVRGAADPVADFKAQMQGADQASLVAETSPGADARPNGAASKLGTLEKSFDHAVFVSLVSQVVGGVSQATSTLVKQS